MQRDLSAEQESVLTEPTVQLPELTVQLPELRHSPNQGQPLRRPRPTRSVSNAKIPAPVGGRDNARPRVVQGRPDPARNEATDR
ncbi:MAG TPA: sugar transferase, partial [Actinoplanes sp.]